MYRESIRGWLSIDCFPELSRGFSLVYPLFNFLLTALNIFKQAMTHIRRENQS